MSLTPRKKRFLIIFGVLAAVAAGIYAWVSAGREKTDDATLEAHVVAIAPKVSGYVVTLDVDDNQQVKKGDLLFAIDPRDYQIALDKAKAELASAEAKLAAEGHNYATTKVSAPSSLESARSQVAAANAEWVRAANDLRRYQKLNELARSRQRLDESIAAEKKARSDLADAKARLQSAETAPNTIAAAEASVMDLQASVDIARANVAQAEKNLADTQVVAPMNGRISRREVETGAYVQPGQQLISLVGNDFWVVANFKENQLEDMKPGQRAEISIDAYPDHSYEGVVDSIQSGTGARFSAFPPENATGNFVKIVQRVPVKILFKEKPDNSLRLGAGMSVVPTVYTR
ncbi:MAG: HlyD family secretion protein [Rickettsiales bacterium]